MEARRNLQNSTGHSVLQPVSSTKGNSSSESFEATAVNTVSGSHPPSEAAYLPDALQATSLRDVKYEPHQVLRATGETHLPHDVAAGSTLADRMPAIPTFVRPFSKDVPVVSSSSSGEC